jgi:hypothetical protein
MTYPPAPITGPVLFVDCPFCDTPAHMDETTGALACTWCALVLPIEDEPAQVEFAAAA